MLLMLRTGKVIFCAACYNIYLVRDVILEQLL